MQSGYELHEFCRGNSRCKEVSSCTTIGHIGQSQLASSAIGPGFPAILQICDVRAGAFASDGHFGSQSVPCRLPFSRFSCELEPGGPTNSSSTPKRDYHLLTHNPLQFVPGKSISVARRVM